MFDNQSAYQFSEAEFEVFFRKYFKLALLVSVRITGNAVAAEDIVQDVFMWIWKNADLIRPGDTMKSLLLTSVKNKSLNYLRDKKDTREIAPAFAIKTDEKDEFEPDERLIFILEQINQLPPRCRDIFMMVVFHEKKYHEAAEHFGVSVNTVKTQMGIAYKQLREKAGATPRLYQIMLQLFKPSH